MDHVQLLADAFEADLPRIEAGTCDRTTGVGCTLIPTTDDGTPAAFYPFYSAFDKGDRDAGIFGECVWGFGNHPVRNRTSAVMPNTGRC